MDNNWDLVLRNAIYCTERTEYFIPVFLLEEAVNYTGQELTEEDAMAQLFIKKYEDDVPFHDMPDDQRNTLIQLRSECESSKLTNIDCHLSRRTNKSNDQRGVRKRIQTVLENKGKVCWRIILFSISFFDQCRYFINYSTIDWMTTLKTSTRQSETTRSDAKQWL